MLKSPAPILSILRSIVAIFALCNASQVYSQAALPKDIRIDVVSDDKTVEYTISKYLIIEVAGNKKYKLSADPNTALQVRIIAVPISQILDNDTRMIGSAIATLVMDVGGDGKSSIRMFSNRYVTSEKVHEHVKDRMAKILN